jgi:hypothetical protein
VHDEVKGKLSGRACGPGRRPLGVRHVWCMHARRVAGPAFPLVWAECTGGKRDGGPTALAWSTAMTSMYPYIDIT